MTRMKRTKLRLVAPAVRACLVVSMLAANAAAQEPCVPTDLVFKIFGFGAGPAPAMFIGAPPAGAADDLPLPAGAVVLGGSARDGGVALVATSPIEPARLEEELSSLLTAGGWKAMSGPPMPRGGFVDPRHQRHGMYCGPDGASLHASVAPGDSGGSLLRYSKSPRSVSQGPCSESFARRRNLDDQGPMPSLVPPGEVRTQSSGSCGSSGGRRAASVVLATSEPPAVLVEHFAEQLAAQGWLFESEASSEEIASQVWSLTVEPTEVWRGILVVATLTEETRDASFAITPRE